RHRRGPRRDRTLGKRGPLPRPRRRGRRRRPSRRRRSASLRGGTSRRSSPASVGDRDHLPAAVGAAGGANLVAEGRFVAGGAARNVGRGELPVRPTLQLLLPGGALLRDSHGKLLQIVRLGRQNGPRAGKAPITTC